MTSASVSWPLAAFSTCFDLPFPEAVSQLARLGFTHVDLPAAEERSQEDLEALANSGLIVHCCSLVRGLADEEMLDAPELAIRKATLHRLQQRVADAARLGATLVYLIPGRDGSEEGLTRFADGCAHLAEFASRRMLRLCIEPVPGRALPTAKVTQAWLARTECQSLGLVLDVGHCLISKEEPATVVRQLALSDSSSTGRLCHVHLDDNDGVSDLHWPLLTGCLTPRQLLELGQALREVNYQGALSLELKPAEFPVQTLQQSVQRCVEGSLHHPPGARMTAD